MRTTNNTRKSKFLAFLLSVMMVSSAGALFASCKDEADSSSSSSSTETTEETKKDTGDIKNANFDFTTVTDTTVIATSVTGWSRSVFQTSSGSASSSKSASGVINVSADKWSYLTEATYTEDALKAMSDADAVAKWDTFKVKDKLAYYDIWKAREANKEKTISKDFEAYESINVDEEDIPTVANPGKVEGSEDDNVLMLHNHYYTSSSKKDQLVGTAQKYTSSSTVTVPAGTSKKVSVWVKTADLKSVASDGTTQDAIGKGAYISITHSVGGKSLDAYEVKNINTEGEWKQYTFYVKGSYYADTTFSLVLGLGQGSTTDRLEYVNGYAFFDNIVLEDIENSAFDTAAEALDSKFVASLEDEKADKTVDTYVEKTANTFAMDFYGTNTWGDKAFDTNVDFKATASTDGSSVNPSAATTDVKTVYADQAAIATAAASNEYLGYVYDNFFKDTDFVANNEILMFLSTNGTAYTAEDAMSFTLPAGQDYMAISFFVKTSDLNGGTGAGVTLVNGLNKTSFSAIDTSDLKGVKVGDDEDAYDGWQQVFFFVERDEDAGTDAMNFTLNFNYGPTDITSAATKSSFTQGFAAFAKFTEYTGMTELEYETAATSTYAKKVVLKLAEDDKAAGNSGFDSAVGVPSAALEEGLANPQNYKGVYNDNYRVKLPTTAADLENESEKRAYNNYNGAAGLLNREEFANYFDTNSDAWLASLKATATGATTAADVWAYHFGDATQPLLIMNDTAATKSYGFIGTAKSTSDEYTAVSLRVKTYNATASVYLIDMDDETRQSVLSVSRALTYWYDDDGNVCTGGPSKNSTTIAFKLQKNGLYKANKNWEGYAKLGDLKDAYFANLSAYTEKDGVLYANENSASHDYYDYTWNREMFYKGSDGAYYTAANNGGDKVLDFASITKDVATDGILEARYLPEAKQELKIENINTNGEWAYVTFYIRKGANAKNYRLEVWSGTRTGNANTTENGYVAFDSNNPGTASTNFALYEEYENIEGITKFDGVFSYFDTDMHVRYNADLDTDKSGNLYAESYVPSTFTESIAYLAYLNNNSDNVYNVFVDYSVSEQSVIAQEKVDDTTEDSEDEEEVESELNIWLLASSIAVAGVLVLAVASIVVRKVVEKYKKKHGARARKTVKEKKAPTAKKAVKKVDEDSPYND